MNLIKKLTAYLLVLVLSFAMLIPAFGSETGTITINPAIMEQTYTVYRIFDLESYSGDAYSYTVNEDWSDFIQNSEAYVSVDDQGYVTWVENADPQEFAKLALAHALEVGLASEDSLIAENPVLVFEDLPLGYYLVDSSVGALCGLTTTNPDAVISEKNPEPTTENTVSSSNNGSIGDTVSLQTVIHAMPGAEKYVLHFELSDGLTFSGISAVKVGDTTLTEGTEYTIETSDICIDCDLHLVFDQQYLNSMTEETSILVQYTAALNAQAVKTNSVFTYLSYGDGTTTEPQGADIFTYTFDLVKTKTDGTVLSGALFGLYDAETDGSLIPLVEKSEGVYRVAAPDEISAEGFVSAQIQAGQAAISGLGNGSYWVEELQAPAGYNKISGRREVTIEDGDLKATVEDGVWQKDGVQVINRAGTLLPSTGGIGTTIFYALGCLLAAGAGLLLYARRKKLQAQ